MGAAWYFNPARWDTRDGYAPFLEVWAAWKTARMGRAMDRLNLIRAMATTHAGDRAQAMIDADTKEALGG